MLNFYMLQVDWLYKTTFKKGLGDSMYVLTRRNIYSLCGKGENGKENKWNANFKGECPIFIPFPYNVNFFFFLLEF